MTTASEAQQYARQVADLYHLASVELSGIVAARAAAGLDVTAQRKQLAELNRLHAQAEDVVRRVQSVAPEAVYAVVTDAYEAGARGAGTVNQRAVHALARASLTQLQSAGPQMLHWAAESFHTVVARAAALASTGVMDARAAAAWLMDGVARQGIVVPGRMRVDSWAEMQVRTATQQAFLQGTVDRLVEAGKDLVVVSASPAGCPLCRPFEGEVFSLSGRSTQYPPLEAARAGGLFHPNCTHHVSAYKPGLSKDPEGTPLGAASLYQARQRQRALERAVRESKRRVAAAEGAGDPAMLAGQRALLRTRQARLNEHLRSDPRLKRHVSKYRTDVRLRG